MEIHDKIEKLGNQLVQHGKLNNRIYLIKFSREDFPESLSALEKLAEKNKYTKIFAKVPASAVVPFLQNNYSIEAYIPRYYSGLEDCLLVSRFFDKTRELKPVDELSAFYELATSVRKSRKLKYKHPLKYLIRILDKKDADQITGIYKQVFQTYPFPIFNKEYIQKNIDDHSVVYFGIFDNQKLVGISSAELDLSNQNAEMTDFATLPEYRGQNIAFKLLITMENEMKIINIKTLYTIARLKAPGMNKTFLKAGYKFSGTLVNNTNISGEIESMNVYYKHLL